MPELDEISYSRGATVDAVRDYYAFLTKMYLHEDSVMAPPEAGWPNITSADPAGLGKTDEVFDLLANLPYIRADGDTAHGAADCFFADWQSQIQSLAQGKTDCDELRIITEGAEFYQNAPPHVIGLAAGADNPCFVLDTELGIVHWSECPGEIYHNPSREPVEDDPYEYAPEDEADWRNDAPAWAIADFFELLKDQFRELNFIPISPHTVISVFVQRGQRSEGMISMLREIYQEHGWPDLERYRKRECLEAVQKALEERYPDQADYHRG
ncbi:hypothetical protein F4821DRAFT_260380 [Hypoxylon rubiginosum]|uniref:Uncharacterized protein n=1 Tax=Hypoxylon rubiginosum TaxID=110542 RepID=A0ACC0D024_9PEZI|nr:hypothetical protein F4821DRAFT_260380 [Hypoxylon rubiginosum]